MPGLGGAAPSGKKQQHGFLYLSP
jgi:RimJ/RimL family protein N-acetyltransferase